MRVREADLATDVEFERAVVGPSSLLQVDEEEWVGPLIVFPLNVTLKALQHVFLVCVRV